MGNSWGDTEVRQEPRQRSPASRGCREEPRKDVPSPGMGCWILVPHRPWVSLQGRTCVSPFSCERRDFSTCAQGEQQPAVLGLVDGAGGEGVRMG